MKFIDDKTEGGQVKGKIAVCCRVLDVSRQGFYDYLQSKNKPYKYAALVDAINEIIEEDEYNDTYGRIRMYQALVLKQPKGVKIPCRETVRKVMRENNLNPNYSRISGIAYENGYVRENSSKTDTLQSFPPNKGALLPWGSDNF